MLELIEKLQAERIRLAELEQRLAEAHSAAPRWWARRRTRRRHVARVEAIETMIAASRLAADDIIDAIAGGARAHMARLMAASQARRERQEAERELEMERLANDVAGLNDARILVAPQPPNGDDGQQPPPDGEDG